MFRKHLAGIIHTVLYQYKNLSLRNTTIKMIFIHKRKGLLKYIYN